MEQLIVSYEFTQVWYPLDQPIYKLIANYARSAAGGEVLFNGGTFDQASQTRSLVFEAHEWDLSLLGPALTKAGYEWGTQLAESEWHLEL